MWIIKFDNKTKWCKLSVLNGCKNIEICRFRDFVYIEMNGETSAANPQLNTGLFQK